MSNPLSHIAMRVAYGASQLPRVAWYVGHSLATRRLEEAARRRDGESARQRAHTNAPVPDRRRLYADMAVLLWQDLANVAAAEELERLHQPVMYRVHAPPSEEKLASLRDFLHGFGISLPPGDQVHPRDFDRVLRRVAGTPEALLVNEVMLRSQSQAEYSPDNIGHFGLALPRYAHFTSPIRRYADLIVKD
jgi:ribonuclease R